jgi:hypothetical protein
LTDCSIEQTASSSMIHRASPPKLVRLPQLLDLDLDRGVVVNPLEPADLQRGS